MIKEKGNTLNVIEIVKVCFRTIYFIYNREMLLYFPVSKFKHPISKHNSIRFYFPYICNLLIFLQNMNFFRNYNK